MEIVIDKVKVLFSPEQIDERVSKLAQQISSDYKYSQNLVIIGVLKGAFIFTSDLVRKLSVPCQIEFIRLSSYHEGTASSGKVKAYDLTLPPLDNKDILIVEDIVDSGRTAKFLLDFLNSQSNAKSVKLASLVDKPCRRLPELAYIEPDYCCFTIDDKFILGYGLDFEQNFRELPYIGFVDGLS